MTTVKEIMTKKADLITVSPETEIAEVAKILLEKGINGAPVVDKKGMLVGIICQSDLITQQKKFPLPSLFTLLDGLIPLSSTKHLEKEVQKMTAVTVAQAMTPDPVTVRPDMTIEEVASLMVDRKYHTLPVVEDDALVGIVGKEDILKTLMSK